MSSPSPSPRSPASRPRRSALRPLASPPKTISPAPVFSLWWLGLWLLGLAILAMVAAIGLLWLIQPSLTLRLPIPSFSINPWPLLRFLGFGGLCCFFFALLRPRKRSPVRPRRGRSVGKRRSKTAKTVQRSRP